MFKEPPAIPARSQLKWAAVDLDGTLAEGIWTPEDPTSKIGPPMYGQLEKLNGLVAMGWKIIIHTARPWHDYEQIEAWLNFYHVPWSQIICGKLLAGIYVDDRAVNALDSVWTTEVIV